MNEQAIAYFRWAYEQGVWKRMHYRGVRILKFPSDLWNYQEIFTEHRIDWVIETGTRHGGAALYFADLLQLNGASGRVVSIDVDPASNMVQQHPRIDFLLGDSSSPDAVAAVRAHVPATRGPLFLILDADHSKAHVLRELTAWTPLLRRGDYLVVEDTCINGHPLRPDFGPGPFEALEEFTASNPGLFVRDVAREEKFGFTCAPRGYLIKT